jgi:hypothetical protein
MTRRSRWITTKYEMAPSIIVIVEELKTTYKMHTFKISKNGHFYGRTPSGWAPTGRHYERWKRRLNLLFEPPKNVTVFQAVRENGRWRGAKKR